MGWRGLPEDVVYAHDALGLGVTAVVNDRSLSFNPDETSFFSQHTILSSHGLTLAAHYSERETERDKDRDIGQRREGAQVDVGWYGL